MPQPLPAVTAAVSVLSIQRVAPAVPAPAATQPFHQQALSLRTLGNRPHPPTWERSAGAARTTPQQVSQRRSGYVRVVPAEVVWAQKEGNGASPTQVSVDAVSSEPLTAQENAALEACAWQLRFGWRAFQNDLVKHALSDLDPAWRPQQRQIVELSARQLLLDTAPSALLAQPVFAQHLSQPGCMRSLQPAMMKWLEAHTDVLEQRDLARAGTSNMTARKDPYLAEMASLLTGR